MRRHGSGDGADLRSLIELLVHTKETERLADVVRRSIDETLEGVGHHTADQAAKRLEKRHADPAARLWRFRAMRIRTAKKSKSYGAALQRLKRARRCYEQTRLAAEWQQLVSDVRAEHHRKTSFMPGFEKLVSGAGPSQEPSFLERAKARWAVPHQRPVDAARSGPAAQTRRSTLTASPGTCVPHAESRAHRRVACR